VAPPGLTKCVEYSHNDPGGAACDTTAEVNDPYISDVAVSADGQYMATAGSNPTDMTQDRVKVWRLSGSVPSQCASINIANAGLGPAFVAFSPNGQYLAVAWQYDFVYIYSVPGFALFNTIQSSTLLLYGVGWSPDSQTVFTLEWDGASDGTLYADKPNGTPITSQALGVDPDVLAVSPVAGTGNVTTLVVGGFDSNAAVYTFSGTTFTAPTIFTTASGVAAWAVRFSPTGSLLGVGGDDGVVRFWNIPLTSATPVGTPISNTTGGTINGLSFSPFGTYVALGYDYQVDVWNVTTRAKVSSSASATSFVDSLTFSASGAALIAGEDRCGRVLICAD
jgi:WD40 repeat protein